MNWMFLQDLGLGAGNIDPTSMMPGELAGLGIGILVAIVLIVVAICVYLALAHMSIARKAGYNKTIAGTSWIFGFGFLITRYIIAKMHWWPWLLIPIAYIVMLPLFFINATLAGIVFLIIILVFYVYTVIWEWKMFEAVKKPGWWALISPIGIVLFYVFTFLTTVTSAISLTIIGIIITIITGIAWLVLIGITAWGSSKQVSTPVTKPTKKK